MEVELVSTSRVMGFTHGGGKVVEKVNWEDVEHIVSLRGEERRWPKPSDRLVARDSNPTDAVIEVRCTVNVDDRYSSVLNSIAGTVAIPGDTRSSADFTELAISFLRPRERSQRLLHRFFDGMTWYRGRHGAQLYREAWTGERLEWSQHHSPVPAPGHHRDRREGESSTAIDRRAVDLRFSNPTDSAEPAWRYACDRVSRTFGTALELAAASLSREHSNRAQVVMAAVALEDALRTELRIRGVSRSRLESFAGLKALKNEASDKGVLHLPYPGTLEDSLDRAFEVRNKVAHGELELKTGEPVADVIEAESGALVASLHWAIHACWNDPSELLDRARMRQERIRGESLRTTMGKVAARLRARENARGQV